MNSFLRLFCIVLFSFHFNSIAQIIGTPVYYEQFASGIPAGWTNVSGSGISHWEYRGPNTAPNISVASRGSCGGGSVPITSQSQSNGFVIFDSNYWDDNDGVCGGLGTGQDPAPHEAILTTASINLSAVATPVLTFQQSYKNYQAVNKVEISVNGGPWTTLLTTAALNSPSSEWKTINITAQAANQADVRIRFVFTGTYYWWQLDDIAIYAPSSNDLQISNPKYTLYNPTVDPFLEMMYHTYPTAMIPSFKFAATGSNVGANTQTGTRLYINLTRGQEVIYTGQTSAVNIAAGASTNLVFAPSFNSPAVPADYVIAYNVDQTQLDATPLNNLDTLDYRISPYQLGRDEAEIESVFVPGVVYQDEIHEIGNSFEVQLNNRKCNSISVVLGEGTLPGTPIYAKFYDINLVLLSQSETYIVNEADINSPGEEFEVVLPLIAPVQMYNDSIYIAVIGHQYSGGGIMRVARSGASPAQTSIVRYPQSNGLFYMLTTPMVRLGVFLLASTPGCNDPEAMNYNPSATVNDGSCRYPGCTDELACNYDPTANFEDGTCVDAGCTDPTACNFDPASACSNNQICIYTCTGCIDETACNYDSEATTDDGTCDFTCYGCTNPTACNFESTATIEDNTCDFTCYGCTNPTACNFELTATIEDNTCDFTCYGCTNPTACNFESSATIEDNTCDFSCYGCTDPTACNYDVNYTIENGTCDFSCYGCTDVIACNYDPSATINDNTCTYPGCTNPLASNYDEAAGCDDGSCVTAPCLGDLSGDGQVNVEDLILFTGSYGCPSGCQFDITGDDEVDLSDLLVFIGQYGGTCD